jgi:hypothetical protein
VLASAFGKTFGLIVTFGGMGVFVNALIIYIVVQVRGERQQNEAYRSQRSQQHPT